MNWKTWVPLILAIGLGLLAMKISRDVMSRDQAAPVVDNSKPRRETNERTSFIVFIEIGNSGYTTCTEHVAIRSVTEKKEGSGNYARKVQHQTK